MDFIAIDKNRMPYRFDVPLAGTTYTLEMHYNSKGDFFTVDLYRGEELLAAGERLVYAWPLFATCAAEGFPGVALIPFDLAWREEDVSWDNLGESVYLYVINREGADDAALQAEG